MKTKAIKLISLVLALCMTLSCLAAAASAETNFEDVSSSKWYYTAVTYCYENGYMVGTSSTKFEPTSTLTRAMFVTILYRMSEDYGDYAGASSGFSDVKSSSWYSDAVAWAVDRGITAGTSATTFSPNKAVTREQMAAFVYRYLTTYGIEIEEADDAVSEFSDMSSVSSWAVTSVDYIRAIGIITGYNGAYRPKDSATRAEAATISWKLDLAIQAVDQSDDIQDDDVQDDDVQDDTTADTTVTYEEAGVYGFSISVLASTATAKVVGYTSRNDDGTNTYVVNFLCNTDEAWLDDNVTFAVENVTPVAYTEIYEALGYDTTTMTLSVSTASFYKTKYYTEPVIAPIGFEYDKTTVDSTAVSGKAVTVDTGAGVVAIKVTALMNGEVVDSIYIGCDGCDSSGSYHSFDKQVYQEVKAIALAQLWTDDMTNKQKLTAVATYISSTCHYPRTKITSEEYNPTLWARWSVEGLDTYYDMFNNVYLNWAADFQGGITTCLAAQILWEIATTDLGLESIDYDSTTGEGVYLGSGSYSSNPTNYFHVSLIYQAEDGTRSFIDAQGLGYSYAMTNYDCADHDCASKLISLN